MEDLIGRVLATEKNPTTIDDFTFWDVIPGATRPVGISRYDACHCTAYRRIEAGDCHVGLRPPRNDIRE